MKWEEGWEGEGGVRWEEVGGGVGDMGGGVGGGRGK